MNEFEQQKSREIQACLNSTTKCFECSICADLYTDPVITNCQHYFCKECIENHISKKRTQHCPLCKSTLNIRSLRACPTLDHWVTKLKRLVQAGQEDEKNLAKSINKQKVKKLPVTSQMAAKRKRNPDNCENLVKKSKPNQLDENGKFSVDLTIFEHTIPDQINKTVLFADSPQVFDFSGSNESLNFSLTKASCLTDATNKKDSKTTAMLPKASKSHAAAADATIDQDQDQENQNDPLKIVTTPKSSSKSLVVNRQSLTTTTATADLKSNKRTTKNVTATNNDQSESIFKAASAPATPTTRPPIVVPDTLKVTQHDAPAPPVTIIYDTLRIDDTAPYHNEPTQPKPLTPKPKVRIKIKFFKNGNLKTQLKPNQDDTVKKVTLCDNASNTEKSARKDATTQINSDNSEIFMETFDFTSFEIKLVNLVYLDLEETTLNSILQDYFDSISKTVPPEVTVIEESPEPAMPVSILTTSTTLRSNLNNAHSSRLNTSVTKFQRVYQPLDFVSSSSNIRPSSFLEKNMLSPKSPNPSHLQSDTVINDTPNKNSEKIFVNSLSKSASRMEAVNSRAMNFSFVKYGGDNEGASPALAVQKKANETIQFESQLAEGSPQTKPVSILIETSVGPVVTAKKNDSLFLNSLADQTLNVTNAAMAAQLPPPPPPQANDILGVSYGAFGDTSLSTTSVGQSKETSPQAPLLKEASPDVKEMQKEDSQITDSELNRIDNLCQDMYEGHNITICQDGISRTTTNVTANANIDKQRNRIEFVCSLIKPSIKDIIKNYASIINAHMADDVTDTTTHLIVDSDKSLVCGVTSKYLKAISRKIWIVSYLWILNCGKEGRILEPTRFEIKGDNIFGTHMGPLRSRSNENKLLFGSYEFMFIGKYEDNAISQNEMVELSIKNGASLVGKAKDFSEHTTKVRVLLFDNSLKKSLAQMMHETAKIFSVNKNWLLDSLACYKCLPYKEYETYDEG
jgi:hypothetical protein